METQEVEGKSAFDRPAQPCLSFQMASSGNMRINILRAQLGCRRMPEGVTH